MSSVYSNLSIKQKADRYAYLVKWRKARKTPFVSILDREVIPAVKSYKKREKLVSQTEDAFSEKDDDNDCNMDDNDDGDDDRSTISDITDCSLICTTYKKSPYLKSLDSQLKETLSDMNYDTHEKVAGLFTTFRNVNPRYGLPILEKRTERRLAEFYNNTLENLK